MVPFHLDWPVDSRGYVFTDKPAEDVVFPFRYKPPRPWITRKGGPLRLYPPLKFPKLYDCLAKHDPTDDGALELVNTYGFLIRDPRDYGASEHASAVSRGIEFLRNLIALKEAGEWRGLKELLDGESPFGGIVFEFLPPLPGDRPTFRIRPTSLLMAAVLQLMQDVSIGLLVKRCIRPGCGKLFEYGPGTGRRETKRYCSKECKDAASYLKRKEAQP